MNHIINDLKNIEQIAVYRGFTISIHTVLGYIIADKRLFTNAEEAHKHIDNRGQDGDRNDN